MDIELKLESLLSNARATLAALNTLVQALNGLRTDEHNIAKVLAANSNRKVSQILNTMKSKKALFPRELLKWSLVHEIADVALARDATLLSVSCGRRIHQGRYSGLATVLRPSATTNTCLNGIGRI